MSDAGWLAVSVMFGSLITTAGTIVGIIISNRNKRKIDAAAVVVEMVSKAAITAVAVVDTKVDGVKEKLDDLHKEINGHMHALIETTKEKGELKGAADNQAKTDAKSQKDK